MGTNCAPLLANLFLQAYEAHGLFKNKDRKLALTWKLFKFGIMLYTLLSLPTL